MRYRPEWNEPCDRYGTVGLLRNLIPLLLLYGAVPHLAERTAYLPWLVAPAIGLLLYRLSIVMHDCLHGTLFRRRGVNRAVGELVGAVTGVDFVEFRRRHLEHHRIYGKLDDPQGFHYLGVGRMSRAAYAWHLVRPLFGLNLPHVYRESVVHPANLARMTRSGRILLVLAVQGAIFLAVTGIGKYPWAMLVPLVSATTFGLFFSQLRGIAEHGVRDGVEQDGFVRSHSATPLDQLFLYDLNFNLHEEHHLHPGIPSCRLPALREASGHMVERGGMCQTVKALAR